MPKINAQKIDFKLGDSNYEGTVKSASIFEGHRLKDEKGSLPSDKVPNTYREFNQAGKLTCEVRTLGDRSSILCNDWIEHLFNRWKRQHQDDLGNSVIQRWVQQYHQNRKEK